MFEVGVARRILGNGAPAMQLDFSHLGSTSSPVSGSAVGERGHGRTSMHC
jgi:hypothetical protein